MKIKMYCLSNRSSDALGVQLLILRVKGLASSVKIWKRLFFVDNCVKIITYGSGLIKNTCELQSGNQYVELSVICFM